MAENDKEDINIYKQMFIKFSRKSFKIRQVLIEYSFSLAFLVEHSNLEQQRKYHYVINLTDGATNLSSGLKERHIS